jgi:hypothetical protein
MKMADIKNDVTDEIFEQVLGIIDSHQDEWMRYLTDFSDSYYNFGGTPYPKVFEQKRKLVTKEKLRIILPYGKTLLDNLEYISREEGKHIKGFFAFIASIHILWEFEPMTFEEKFREHYNREYAGEYTEWNFGHLHFGLPNLRYSALQERLGCFIEDGMYGASDDTLLLWGEMMEMSRTRDFGLLRHCLPSFDWFEKEYGHKYQ